MLGQPRVDLRPIVSVIGGTEHAIPVAASEQWPIAESLLEISSQATGQLNWKIRSMQTQPR